jgi:hypothetical protein
MKKPTKDDDGRVEAESLDILLGFNLNKLQERVIGRVLEQVSASLRTRVTMAHLTTSKHEVLPDKDSRHPLNKYTSEKMIIGTHHQVLSSAQLHQ